MNKVIAGIGMVARLAMGLAILAVVVVWNALTPARGLEHASPMTMTEVETAISGAAQYALLPTNPFKTVNHTIFRSNPSVQCWM
jgi:hypothetical protein